VLTDLWHRAFDAQPQPPRLLVVLTALVALLLVAPRPVWRIARNVITIAHEGGHALIALLSGRRLQSIRLHSDTSGLTVTRGRPTGLGMVTTLAAGYTTPSLLGLAGAALLAVGRIRITLWLALLLLVAVLVMTRNIYGILSVVITGGVVFVVSWYGSPTVQAAFAYLGAWFLLLGGVRPIIEVQGQRRRRQVRDSDADQLAGLTRVPGVFWIGVFLVVALAALALSVVVLGITPNVTWLKS
jgi:hypothetical protein